MPGPVTVPREGDTITVTGGLLPGLVVRVRWMVNVRRGGSREVVLSLPF